MPSPYLSVSFFAPPVIGALIGKQEGRNIEVMNSFELLSHTVEEKIIIDKEYYYTKEEQCERGIEVGKRSGRFFLKKKKKKEREKKAQGGENLELGRNKQERRMRTEEGNGEHLQKSQKKSI
jgi:hypothetical protein